MAEKLVTLLDELYLVYDTEKDTISLFFDASLETSATKNRDLSKSGKGA